MDLFLRELDKGRSHEGREVRSLCYAPFVQLHFGTDGTVAACSKSLHRPLGNIRTERLPDLWNGPSMSALRESLSSYVFPPGCESCAWQLRRGNWKNHPLLDFDEIPPAEDGEWPSRLEFALSNTCNLECIQCSGDLSSRIRAREGKPPIGPAYDDRFFEDLRPFLKHARATSFLGGEPFLQKECYRIWRTMIEMGLGASVFVTTNGTVFNRRVEEILEALPVDLAISVDGVSRSTVESIRVGAKHDVLFRNLGRFRDYARSRKGAPADVSDYVLTLNFCLMRANWREAPDFFLLAEEWESRVWITPVVHPSPLSLFSLPADELRNVSETLERRSDEILPRLRRNRVRWLETLRMLRTSAQQASRAVGTVRPWASRRVVAEAVERIRAGDVEGGVRSLERVSRADPEYGAALLVRAEVAARAGALGRADTLLDEALSRRERIADVRLHRAWLRLSQGRIREGLEEADALERTVRGDRSAPSYLEDGLWRARAYLLLRTGDRAGALRAFEILLSRRPGKEALADLRAVLAHNASA